LYNLVIRGVEEILIFLLVVEFPTVKSVNIYKIYLDLTNKTCVKLPWGVSKGRVRVIFLNELKGFNRMVFRRIVGLSQEGRGYW